MEQVLLTASAISDDHSYAGIPSSYPLTNILGKESAKGTSYGGINLTTGSNAASYFYLEFDTSAIPQDATIINVTATARMYGSSTAASRTSKRQIQLSSGTTLKGEAVDWEATGKATIYEITNGGTWTRDELNDLRMRIYVVRNTSNTSNTTSIYMLGADVTIEYNNGAKHTLTIQSNGFSVDPSEGGEYPEGTIVPITIAENPLPKVTLDGADITSLFTQKSQETSYSGAPSASSYSGVSSGTSGIASAVGKTAENPASISSNWYGSSGATVDSQYAQYTFDLADIPSNATNIKVSCKVAGKAENSTYSHQAGGRYSVWALCCNGVAKSEQIHATSTSVEVLEFSDTGNWTREELNGLQLRHYVGYYGGTTNGATLTISYELPGGGETYVYNLAIDADHVIVIGGGDSTQTIMVKVNGVWKAATKVYRKQNGTWEQVTDIQSLFDGAQNGTWSGYFKDN